MHQGKPKRLVFANYAVGNYPRSNICKQLAAVGDRLDLIAP